jgi:hypothetical protein
MTGQRLRIVLFAAWLPFSLDMYSTIKEAPGIRGFFA